MTAYEIGARTRIGSKASLSVSTYYNVYDNLRTIDPGPTASGLPLQFGNLMTGRVYGVEVWGSYQVTDWWRLSTGFNLLHEDLTFHAGALTAVGLAFVANDPNQQATLHSAMNLSENVTWDAYMREVAPLPHPGVPGYAELDTRIGWNVTKSLNLSLAGCNLLHARHQEFLEGGAITEIPRSILAQARIRF